MPTWKVDQNVSPLPKDVLVCLFVQPETGENKTSLYYKIFIIINDDGTHKIFGQRFLKSNTEDLLSPTCFLSETITTETTFVKKLRNPESEEHVHDVVTSLFEEIEARPFVENQTINENIDIMFKWVTYAYVGVLPMRSIGPLQWTRSTSIKPSNREKNYQRASDQAEILSELLDDANKDGIDWKIADTFREHLVKPYSFRKDGNQIVADNIQSDQRSERNTKPLLKIPDGIIEAEQLILLLSQKRNLTITLEEPDRGMHPQMINKLRNFVLKKVTNKTVLVISHQPSILDHSTMERTHLCTKSIKDGTITQEVRKLPKGSRRYGIIEEMKCLLFSERVLFVEGFTDQIIVEAIFDVVIHDLAMPPQNMKFLSGKKYKEFISSLHVTELKEGGGAGPKKMTYCEEIQRESFVLYDFDVVLQKRKGNKAEGKYIIAFELESKDIKTFLSDKAAIVQFEKECEKVRSFVWMDKALEEVINKISSQLDSALATRLEIPIKKKFKKWKHNLIDKEEGDIKNLAIKLIENSGEVQRFLQFFSRMMPSVDRMTASVDNVQLNYDDVKKQQKRRHGTNIEHPSAKKNKADASSLENKCKKSNSTTSQIQTEQEVKSNESGLTSDNFKAQQSKSDIMSDESENGGQDSDDCEFMDDENQKTGLSQDMLSCNISDNEAKK